MIVDSNLKNQKIILIQIDIITKKKIFYNIKVSFKISKNFDTILKTRISKTYKIFKKNIILII